MPTKIPLLSAAASLACFFLAGQTDAASFDCAKAGSDVEKLICQDPGLLLLDEQLEQAYQSAVKSTGNAKALKSQQQQWLVKIRDQCQEKSCLQDAYQTRIAELGKVADNQWLRYHDQELGIEFSYPPGRKVSKHCHDSHRCVALVAEQMPAGSEYLLAFEVFDGDLRRVASHQAIFFQQSGGWMAKGRNGQYPAQFLAGEGWEGIFAVVDCGVTDEAGFFHAAAGECYWAVLSNGRRSVVIDSEGLAGNDPLSRRSIQSFKFTQ